MQRAIENELKKWHKEDKPHPLLIRGARQVGKSYTIEKFGKENFKEFILINFEHEPELKNIFNETLDPQKIFKQIYAYKNKNISIGKTLLFFDEIQECPQAILALRYFYEKAPGLHVIGAGSLLDFTLQSGQISVPVGRIHYLYMQPISFLEYLQAKNREGLIEYIESLGLEQSHNDPIHKELNNEIQTYMLTGGMPEIIDKYIIDEQNIEQIIKIQNAINANYRDDFGKYSKLAQHKHLENLFTGIPKLLGQKFKYSRIDQETPSRDLKAALELLIKAGIVYKIKRANATGLPFEAGASEKHFKINFLDIGLAQNILGLTKEIIIENDFHSIAAGALAEQLVGQEILAYKNFFEEKKLYYWEREDRSSSAEIDYLIAIGNKQIPVEVKAGTTGRLTSLKIFMEKYNAEIGIRISKKTVSFENNILSVPFYAISQIERLVKLL